MSDQDPFARRTPFDVTVPVDGGSIRIRYRPRFRDDPAFQAEMARIEAGQLTDEEMVDPALGRSRLLVHVIAAWDVTDAGRPVPVAVETLRRLPVPILEALTRGVGEHATALSASVEMQLSPEHRAPPPMEPGKN